MVKHFKVKKLEDIAFHASYMEILANLSLCPEHRPEERRNLASYASILSLNPLMEGKIIRQFVRNRLSQHLIGTFSDEIRQRYVNEFNQYLYDSDMKPSPWVFFDTVLDDSFTDLTVGLSSPGGVPDTQVIPVVAGRSPHIKSLKLNFELLTDKATSGLIKPIILALSSLKYLSSLSLVGVDKNCKPYFIHLGTACPVLKHLSFNDSFLTKKDILNLLFGENVQTIEELNIDEEKLHCYSVTNVNLLTPFTATIENLELEVVDERSKLDKYHSKSGTVSPSVIAFLLRHLPNLRSISSLGFTLTSAISLLLSVHSLEPSTEWTALENDSAKVPCLLNDNQPKLIYKSFEGRLCLSKLEFLDHKNYNSLHAVHVLCPNISEILLKTNAAENDPNGLSDESSDSACGDAVNVFTSWNKKVKKLTFCAISAVDREEVLNLLGSELHSLTYSNCSDITVKEVSVCTKLEKLQFLFSSTFSSCIEFPSNSQFLPNLHTIESDVCFGDCDRFFLDRQNLLHIKLECCHVVKESNNWLELIKLWPRVETLKMLSCRGLTMEMAGRVFIQMNCLKSLILPYLMLYKKDERAASLSFKEKMESLKVAVLFEKGSWNSRCPFAAEPIEWEHSDNETSDDEEEMGDEIKIFHIPGGIDWVQQYEDYDDFNDYISDSDDDYVGNNFDFDVDDDDDDYLNNFDADDNDDDVYWA